MIVLNKVTRNVPAADKAVYSSNTGMWAESPLVKGFLKWRTILGHFFGFVCLVLETGFLRVALAILELAL